MAGGIVDNQEHLATMIFPHKISQKLPKGCAIEYSGKVIREIRLEAHRTKQVRCFTLSIGIYPRLAPHRRPRLMQGHIKPKAGLVFKENHS